jgi:hypothetical protein
MRRKSSARLGRMLSDEPDYFNVIWYENLFANGGDRLHYLALWAGWRFLTVPKHQDVWFEEALFDI